MLYKLHHIFLRDQSNKIEALICPDGHLSVLPLSSATKCSNWEILKNRLSMCERSICVFPTLSILKTRHDS